jgi:hypothetical protein
VPALDERTAEETREMTAELVLEAGAGPPWVSLDETLDGGTVLEQSWCPTGCARASRGCGFHAGCIGGGTGSRDPWRE